MPPKPRSRVVRIATALVLVLVGVALVAPGAFAHNHLVKLREVYAGSTAHPGDEYVEVQMYSAGQNVMENEVSVNFYNAAGSQTYSFAPITGAGNPPNGESQRRVLFASASAQADFSKS